MKKILSLLPVLFMSIVVHAQCWKTVSGGYNNTFAIKDDGTLWVWGYNPYGQLGDGTTTNIIAPKQIGISYKWNIKCRASESWHNFIIKNDNTIWASGYNYSGQLGNGANSDKYVLTQITGDTDWIAISTGANHTIALKANGTLWGWGDNKNGQLGDGTSSTGRNAPVQIGSANDWVAINVGAWRSYGIKANGTLWGWGRNDVGELGDGSALYRYSPVRIGLDSDWLSINSGPRHSLAIKKNGTLWAWGENSSGKLGDSTYLDRRSPIQIGNEHTWEMASAGASHSLALKNDGTLWAWGANDGGKLGDGTVIGKIALVQIGTDTNWQSVSAGNHHSVAIKTDGSLWVWGYNNYGQLGDGTTVNKYIPTLLGCPASVAIKEQISTPVTLSVSPNPATNVVYIDNQSHVVIDNINIQDIMGKVILHTSNTTNIDCSAWPAGLYLVSFFSEGATYHYRLVKQ